MLQTQPYLLVIATIRAWCCGLGSVSGDGFCPSACISLQPELLGLRYPCLPRHRNDLRPSCKFFYCCWLGIQGRPHSGLFSPHFPLNHNSNGVAKSSKRTHKAVESCGICALDCRYGSLEVPERLLVGCQLLCPITTSRPFDQLSPLGRH